MLYIFYVNAMIFIHFFFRFGFHVQKEKFSLRIRSANDNAIAS